VRGCRVVELSHQLYPGREEYQLQVENRYVEDLLPEYQRPPEAWYIMSEVSMWSHVGTHMESPFHYLRAGQDVSQIPLDRVVGEGIVVDLTDKGVGDPITRTDLQERGAGIRRGDIVLVRTGLSHSYRTPRSHDRPYFTEDAIQWLVERQIGCLGVDCSGIERRGQPQQPNHDLLFSHGIPLIEHLANLEQLQSARCFIVAVPWRVRGLEASPVSVIAFEWDTQEPEGSEKGGAS
jgi:arylformamidase